MVGLVNNNKTTKTMNIQLKLDIGQTVYRIASRIAQVGTVESYTIKLNNIKSNQHIEEYIIVFSSGMYPVRVKYPSTKLDEVYETKEECEKAILKKYFGHLLKEGAIK